jgi:hypothetical protein
MTSEFLTSAIKKLERDLAWRGPNGKMMSHIVLERAQAVVVLHRLKGNGPTHAEDPD